ncbi:MAG: hypothetical protein HZC05_00210, partial [Candidatus Magasanikbacteria bacterium]|nr:hypothetical protein [Candidatus Magasanikbacteria bacterium]
MNILTFIFGLGVVVMALCLYALTQGCEGGGSDSGTDGGCVESCSSCPACGYIENGICMLNNCTYNGDSWVGIDNGSLPGDSVPTYADGKPIP